MSWVIDIHWLRNSKKCPDWRGNKIESNKRFGFKGSCGWAKFCFEILQPKNILPCYNKHVSKGSSVVRLWTMKGLDMDSHITDADVPSIFAEYTTFWQHTVYLSSPYELSLWRSVIYLTTHWFSQTSDTQKVTATVPYYHDKSFWYRLDFCIHSLY